MWATDERKMTIGRIAKRRRDEFFLILTLVVLSLGRTLEAAPVETRNKSTRHEETLISGLSSRKGHQEEEVGNPSELAWQAWLLVDGNSKSQSSSGVLDSATLMRRITPKSIFIAPALTACAEGYQADTMNRCVKDVSIDSQAHRGFLVERLNAIFANVAKPQFSSSSSSSSSLPTGPLQLSIPLLMPGPSKPIQETLKLHPEDKQESNEKLSNDENSKIPREEYSNRDNISHEALVTVYELEDESKDNDSTFFLGNKSTEIADENSQISSTKLNEDKIAVPLGEFLDDSGAKLSGIVGYKIPAGKEKTFQSSNLSENSDKHEDNDASKESQVSPTLVLLLSPTKLPVPPALQNNGRIIVKVENVTGNVTGKEIIRDSASEDLSTRDILENSTTDSKIDGSELTSGERESSPVTEEIYDESTELYEEKEEEEEEEDVAYDQSTEQDDEILKHSEAGVTVKLSNEKSSPKSSTIEFANVGSPSDKEPTGSSEISSEVSVNRDFVRETTLVDFNVSRLANSPLSTSSSKKNYQETTTSVPAGSKELEMPETRVGSLDNLMRNEKRDGNLPKVKEFFGDMAGNENNQGEESKNENSRLGDKTSHVSSSLNKNSDLVLFVNESIGEKMPEAINPVRGIEEAFEDSLASDFSSTSRSESVETMMAASTNVAGTIVSGEEPKVNGTSEKLESQASEFSDETTTTKITSRPTSPRHEEIYDYLFRDYPSNRPNPHGIRDDDAPPIIRTIDEESYRPEANYETPSRQNDEKFVSSQQRDEDYVRFPNYEERHENRVRFPSDEANSITNDYKERTRRPYANQQERQTYNRAPESQRVNLPDIHEKESYWWSPNEWHTGRQQQQQQQQQGGIFSSHRSRSTLDQRSRDRSPMLLRFWTRMPLVRDPSLSYPTRSSLLEQNRRQVDSRIDSRSPLSTRGSARRVNYYREMSNRDMNRSFGRNKPAVDG